MDHPIGTGYAPLVAKRLTGQPWIILGPQVTVRGTGPVWNTRMIRDLHDKQGRFHFASLRHRRLAASASGILAHRGCSNKNTLATV
jgi:hypothetical protein